MDLSGIALLDLVADGLHQVGLAHADAAVQEQRVVGLGGTFADGARRGMRKLIAGADDEIVERVFGIQLRGSIPIETLLLNGAAAGCQPRAAASSATPVGSRLLPCGVLLLLSVTNSTSWNSRPRSSMASLIRSP